MYRTAHDRKRKEAVVLGTKTKYEEHHRSATATAIAEWLLTSKESYRNEYLYTLLDFTRYFRLQLLQSLHKTLNLLEQLTVRVQQLVCARL